MKYDTMNIKKSDKPNKKYVAVFSSKMSERTKETHFGSAGMTDYLLSKEKDRRDRYRSRHKKDLLTNDPTRAGYLCTNTPKIFYINLDKRTDKRNDMEKLLNGYDYERVAAIEDRRGYIGCCKSHILSLQLAKSRRYKSVIILEDDFIFKTEYRFNTMNIPDTVTFDMLLLSNIIKSSEIYDNDFRRVFKAEWTSGYLINEKFYDSLICVFKESLEALMINYCRENYLDVYWEKIFNDSIILTHNYKFGGQREGYSDIQNKNIKRDN